MNLSLHSVSVLFLALFRQCSAKTELKRNEKSYFFSSFLLPAVRTKMGCNKKRSGKMCETNEPVAQFWFHFVSLHFLSFYEMKLRQNIVGLMNLSQAPPLALFGPFASVLRHAVRRAAGGP